MRDFRDAKTMARALRETLKSRAVEILHSDLLELIAKTFGYENWNILSAKIKAARPQATDAEASNAGAADPRCGRLSIAPSAEKASSMCES